MDYPHVCGLCHRGAGFSTWVVSELPGVSMDYTPPLDAPYIRLRDRAATLYKPRVSTSLNNGFASEVYRVHANTLANLERGFCTRVWRYKGEEPAACTVTRWPKFERALRGWPCAPFTAQQVVDSALPRRRKLLQSAADSLSYLPIRRQDAAVSTFIKAEKFNYSRKPDADPRLIQPRSNRYLVAHGRYIKAIEKSIYLAMGRLQRHPMVAKGFNAEETGRLLREKWDMYRDPVCIGLDASRFDQHVSVPMLKATHRIYRRFINTTEFNRLCELQLVNKGYARCPQGGFKYEVEGRRMSGDMDTSLGNCIIMCAITYEMVAGWGQIFNNGDDCIIILERQDLPRLSNIHAHYLQYGFRVEVEPVVDTFERIEFCQTQPVWADRWVMCRNPSAMAKDLTYIGPREARDTWLDAIGQCGMALTDGVPFFSVFYRTLLNGHKSKVRNSMLYSCGFTRLAERMTYQARCISQRARYSFYLAFGMEPQLQYALELAMGPAGKNIEQLQPDAYIQYITTSFPNDEDKKTKQTAPLFQPGCPRPGFAASAL
nr:putative RNA-dependent RNA polymerase [Poaceae Liege umbravirus 2]